MSRHLQHLLHRRLDTAATVLDLSLNPLDLERLAVELTPAIKALLAESDAELADVVPVEYALTDQAGPVDRHVTDYDGCRSAIHPEVNEDSPAALLALELRSTQPDVIATDVPTPTHLTLTVEPQSLRAWAWWQSKFSVTSDTVLRHDQVVTGTGHYGDITVHLRGQGVGTLLDTAAGRRDRLADLIGKGHRW